MRQPTRKMGDTATRKGNTSKGLGPESSASVLVVLLELATSCWFLGVAGYYYYSKGFLQLLHQLVREGLW